MLILLLNLWHANDQLLTVTAMSILVAGIMLALSSKHTHCDSNAEHDMTRRANGSHAIAIMQKQQSWNETKLSYRHDRILIMREPCD